MKKLLSSILIAFLSISVIMPNPIVATNDFETDEQVVPTQIVGEEPITDESKEDEVIVEEVVEEIVEEAKKEIEEAPVIEEENIEETNKEESQLSEDAEDKEKLKEEQKGEPAEKVAEETPAAEEEMSDEASGEESKPSEDAEDVENIEGPKEETIGEVETEEQPIVGGVFTQSNVNALGDAVLLGDALPGDSEVEGYFELEEDSLEYNGEIQVPKIVLKDNAPDYNYHVDFEIVSTNGRLITVPKNVGSYIVRAIVSYSNPHNFIDEMLSIVLHKTRILEFPYEIYPKNISNIVASELTYNGENQLPKLFANHKELIEGVDFEFAELDEKKDYKNSHNAGGIIEHTADVVLKNYTLNWESECSVKYFINKRFAKLPKELRYTYTGNVITPKIECTDMDGNIVPLDFSNMLSIKKGEWGTWPSYSPATFQDPGKYVAFITVNDEFLYNYFVNEIDLTIFTDPYTIAIPAYIDKATIEYDFDALYYNGEAQLPNIKFTGINNVNLTSNIIVSNVPRNSSGVVLPNYQGAVGSYYLDVEMDAEAAKYYKWPDYVVDQENSSKASIGFRINQRPVEFAGWDFEAADAADGTIDGVAVINGSLLTINADFKYTMEDGVLCLEYNGFNPFLFKTVDGYAPIPDSKYTYTVGDQTIDTIINRADYKYYPLLPSEALKLGVGTYYSNIVVENDNYAANDVKASFKVTPKPITVEWTKTVIDINDTDKDPKCEIVGLAPIDQIGFYYKDENQEWQCKDRFHVEYSYYKYDSDGNLQKLAGYPLNYNFTEEGRYAVKAEKVVNLLGYANPNYVFDEVWTTFVIVDNTTVHDNGDISVGTINNISTNTVGSVELQVPSVNQMEALIARLNDLGDETGTILQDALDHNKHIDIYLEANEVTPQEVADKGLILSKNNSIVVDLKLYALVAGDTNRYPLTDTGTYKASIKINLTTPQVQALGYNDSKCFYIDRYHNSIIPDSTQMVEPDINDGIYSFTLISNKFSDFAIYVGNEPVEIEVDDYHIVPYTQA